MGVFSKAAEVMLARHSSGSSKKRSISWSFTRRSAGKTEALPKLSPSSANASADVNMGQLRANLLGASTGQSVSVSNAFLCPISQEVMQDPVTLGNTGHTFDRASIETWLKEHDTDPLTNLPLRGARELIPNHALRTVIEELSRLNASGAKKTVLAAPDAVTSDVPNTTVLHRAPYTSTEAAAKDVDLSSVLRSQLAQRKQHKQRRIPVESGSLEHNLVRKAIGDFFGTERLVCLRGVERIENFVLAQKFKAFTPVGESNPIIYKVHGTRASAADDIIKDGFRLPTEKDIGGRYLAGELSRSAHDFEYLKLGGGIYFTSHGTKADAFGGAESVMFICAIRPGKVWRRSEEDSTLDGEKVRDEGYDSVYCPGCTDAGTTQLDEYVLYNPDAVYPMYAVKYWTVRVRTVDYFLQQLSSLSSDRKVDHDSVSKCTDPQAAAAKIQQISAADLKKSQGSLVDELVCIANVCRDTPKKAVFLENVPMLHSLLQCLGSSCEVTQWQALRVVANFAYKHEGRQRFLHMPKNSANLYPALANLLRSANGAVVQKAAFVACNIRANYHPNKDFVYNRVLLDALVNAISTTNEDMTALYLSAALGNFVVTREAAKSAIHALPRVVQCFTVAAMHAQWAQWVTNVCRNFVSVGYDDAFEVAQSANIGFVMTGLVRDSKDVVLQSSEVARDVLLCLSSLARGSVSVTEDMLGAGCVESLAQLIGSTEESTYYAAQAMYQLCARNPRGRRALTEPAVLQKLVRQIRSTTCVSTRQKLATVICLVDDAHLRTHRLDRLALKQAAAAFQGRPVGVASTSLKDGS